jgi:hypothetical protein
LSSITYEAKKAYFARVRRRNYLASLRIEGFEIKEMATAEKLPSKAEVLSAHTRSGSGNDRDV